MKRIATTLAAQALLVIASQAVAADRSMIIGIGLSHGTADIAANAGNVNSAFQTPELGGRFEYWNLMRENYAVNFSANVGFSSETDKPRANAPANTPEQKFTTSSWSIRLGGDRVFSPNENTKVFFGPGFEYWSGKAKFEGGAAGFPLATAYETKNVTRISLHGHMGGMMMIGPNWGLSGQIGHKVGLANYTENGGKTNWMPSSFDGAMELLFSFGGK